MHVRKRVRDAAVVAKAALRGALDLSELVLRKGLHRDHLWMVYDGGVSYAVAIAKGDATPERERLARLEICMACGSREPHPEDPFHSGYCGPSGINRTASAINPTCGCPIDGVVAVKSKTCPQHRWVGITVKGRNA